MVQCQACQAELTEQDLNWGSCPKCGIAVSRAGRGTLVTPADPEDIRSSGLTEVTEAEAVPESGNAMDSQGTMEPFLVGEASGPEPTALPDVSVEDILEAANTRMSINTNDLPLPVRLKVTSMMFGEDTEANRSIAESLDLNQDLDADEPTQRSMYDQSNAETNVIEMKDDDSGSTWQGIPGKGAESNLHIQDRSVIKDNRDGTARTDYQLISMIGKGGMGTVWKAKQYSIGRDVAVKMIKPEKALNKESRERFLSEAVVTGDLDHPNIVPIHDLGRFESNELFYSMRQVTGMAWDKILLEKSLEENLDIWTKMADAIAFAHSRGVIHRDIKPENVMVGEFGEVLVMDWGLALPLPNFRRRSIINTPTASGGSPAYMAPEMIGLRLDRVGPWSDIYLLGATLYEIATEQPPHPGRTVSECISNARDNVILPYHKAGMRQELVQIALKAMATDPKDRYQTVKELQEAVKLFEERQESIKLADNAEVAKNRGKEFEQYDEFARSVFGFEEAINRWDGNETAKAGLDEAKLAYAECALKKNDFDLGISLLQPRNPAHAPMIQKLKDGKQNRDKQAANIRRQRQMLTGLGAMLLIGAFGAIAFFSYQNNKLAKSLTAEQTARQNEKDALDKQNEALKKERKARDGEKLALKEAKDNLVQANTNLEAANAAKKRADDQTIVAMAEEKKAVAAALLAEEQKKKAEDQRKKAEMAEMDATNKKKEAENARIAADKATFESLLRLTATQIESNFFTPAGESIAKLNEDKYKTFVADNQAAVDLLSSYMERGGVAIPGDTAFQAVAVSPDGKLIATGTADGQIQFWTIDGKAADNLPVIVHRDPADAKKNAFSPITGLSFSPDGRLLASSANSKVARIWEVATHNQVAKLEHHDHVQSIHFSPQGDVVATTSRHVASAKDNFTPATASVRLWNLSGDQVGQGQGHLRSVNAAAWAKDGRHLVTGGDDAVIVWSRDAKNQLKLAVQFDEHHSRINAVALSADGIVASAGDDKLVMLWSLSKALGSASKVPEVETLQQQKATIRSLAFSAKGDMLASAADDNTLCIWNVARSVNLRTTLRGHGSSVLDCAFIADTNQVVSASSDYTARIWDLKSYKEPDANQLKSLKSDAKIISAIKAHTDDVRAVALNGSGTEAVTAANDQTTVLWDTVTGERLKVFKDGQEFLADKVILFGDDKYLVTGGQDQVVCLWDVERGVQLNSLMGGQTANALAVSPDSRWLATSGEGNALQLWDLPALLKGIKPKGPTVTLDAKGSVVGLAFSKDGLQVAAATISPTAVVVADIEKQTIRKQDVGNDEDEIELSGIAFLPDGKRVVTSDSEGLVKLWNVSGGEPTLAVAVKGGAPQPLIGMSLSADGTRLAAIRSPVDEKDPIAQVAVWDLTPKDPKKLREVAFAAKVGTVTSVSLSPDGKHVAAASKDLAGTRFVQQWSVDSQDEPDALKLGKQSQDAVLALQLTADGRVVIALGAEANLWRWDGQSASQYYRSLLLTAATLSPNGKLVVTGGLDGALKVWNSESGLCMARISAHADKVNDLMFSPKDESALVSTSFDGTAKIWTWNDADKTLTLKKSLPHKGSVSRGRYSDDGAHIATGCEDKFVRLWNAQGELEKDYLHDAAIVSLDVNADGTMVVIADDTLVKLVDFSKDKPVAFLGRPIAGHGRELTDVRFMGFGKAADGQSPVLRILTTSLDGTGKIWELNPRGAEYAATEILTLDRPGRTSGVSAMAVTHDGTAIVTGHKDGSRLIWRSP